MFRHILANVNRFAKIFHQQILEDTCSIC